MKKGYVALFSTIIAIILVISSMSTSFAAVKKSPSAQNGSCAGITVEKTGNSWAAMRTIGSVGNKSIKQIDRNYSGVAQNRLGWWRVKNGYVDFSSTGVFQNDYGWWRVANGKVNFKATGVYQNDLGWWRVENGKVNFKATGVYQNNNGWWRVVDGKVDFKAKGVFSNQHGNWLIKNGKVEFSNKYDGFYNYKGKVYTTKDGKATPYNYNKDALTNQLNVTYLKNDYTNICIVENNSKDPISISMDPADRLPRVYDSNAKRILLQDMSHGNSIYTFVPSSFKLVYRNADIIETKRLDDRTISAKLHNPYDKSIVSFVSVLYYKDGKVAFWDFFGSQNSKLEPGETREFKFETDMFNADFDDYEIFPLFAYSNNYLF